jgi:hypothetical protein
LEWIYKRRHHDIVIHAHVGRDHTTCCADDLSNSSDGVPVARRAWALNWIVDGPTVFVAGCCYWRHLLSWAILTTVIANSLRRLSDDMLTVTPAADLSFLTDSETFGNIMQVRFPECFICLVAFCYNVAWKGNRIVNPRRGEVQACHASRRKDQGLNTFCFEAAVNSLSL